tara:strand:- start:1833 stop:2612 length:780 start_codon:yes stop_codon:yes gene_type:complete
MSSAKQELAAILMNYTDKMSEETYMSILNDVQNIPDHKAPKLASEQQNEIDRLNKQLEESEIQIEELNYQLSDLEEYIENEQGCLLELDRIFHKLLKNGNIHIDSSTRTLKYMSKFYHNHTENCNDFIDILNSYYHIIANDDEYNEQAEREILSEFDTLSIGSFDVNNPFECCTENKEIISGECVSCIFNKLYWFDNYANNCYGYLLLHEKYLDLHKQSRRFNKLFSRYYNYYIQSRLVMESPRLSNEILNRYRIDYSV